ncbi:hypothetical protein [Aquimarina pacifica]|uniref:hypothetical protein n=1 Tax=Aquimarina pacifica TaxID=1296415 RepID=UPI0004703686|nr:hypothetical protein [Aquimarina pacifica]
MKKLLYFLFFLHLLSSCDDGDIIVTSFEFDEVDLELCRGSLKDEYVFFKINDDTQEAISFDFVNESFSDTTVTTTPIYIDIGDDVHFIYRSFNSEITSDYFCGTLPSSDITILEELLIISGTAEISTSIITEDDNDGVDAEDEDVNGNGDLEDDDTDGDGIPNYKDQDDDGDNILTSVELVNDIADNDDPRDTDGDGIPDYLEEDDDNDGVLTRNEDTNQNGSPRDDRETESGELFYLDPEFPETPIEVPPILDNTIQTTYRTIITISNLVFEDENENFEDEDFSFGYIDTTVSKVTSPN